MSSSLRAVGEGGGGPGRDTGATHPTCTRMYTHVVSCGHRDPHTPMHTHMDVQNPPIERDPHPAPPTFSSQMSHYITVPETWRFRMQDGGQTLVYAPRTAYTSLGRGPSLWALCPGARQWTQGGCLLRAGSASPGTAMGRAGGSDGQEKCGPSHALPLRLLRLPP